MLPLEKDFSPTLAGDALADERDRILRWLHEVPALIRRGAGGDPVRVALKLMNARHGEAFQLDMVEAAGGADALVCFNRLWSAERGRRRTAAMTSATGTCGRWPPSRSARIRPPAAHRHRATSPRVA